MIRRPPRSTLFPTRRSSDLERVGGKARLIPPLGIATRQSTDVLAVDEDRKSTRLNSSHTVISYAVFCLKKKNPHACRGQLRHHLPYAERPALQQDDVPVYRV